MDTVPSAGAIVWRTMREAPKPIRRQLQLVGLTGLSVLLLQYFDVRGRYGPRVWAEMASVVLFAGGMLLLGVMRALRDASAETVVDEMVHEEGRRRVHRLVRRKTLGPILFALPTMGLIAGAALAAAATVLVVRFFLGSSAIVLVLAAADLFVLLAAIRVVSNTTRFLYGRAVEGEAAAARAEGEAARAQLAALQAQMNPHFLFNALNTVASLVRSNPRSAEATVENLSDVLRRTLERTSQPIGTLADEIDYIKAYLAVEQERFGDRLNVEWAVAPDLRDAPVPAMTLQPLVENAIRHGMGPRRAGGRVRIAADVEGSRLRLTVEDDGDGFPPRYHEGTGLANLRKRLQVLHGDAATLRIGSPPAGARVIVELPQQSQSQSEI